MNKKVWLGFIVVLVLMEVVSYVVHTLILGATYESLKSLWRPDMQSHIWMYQVISVIGAFFFTFIFSKGYEGKGLAEGIRYGLYIGIWMSVGMAYGTYAMIAIPYSLALQWFIYGVISYVIYGIALAMVFGKKAAPPAA
jgi:hypothetical protein